MKRYLLNVNPLGKVGRTVSQTPQLLVLTLHNTDCIEILTRFDMMDHLHEIEPQLSRLEFDLYQEEVFRGPNCRFTLFATIDHLTDLVDPSTHKLPTWFDPNDNEPGLLADIYSRRVPGASGVERYVVVNDRICVQWTIVTHDLDPYVSALVGRGLIEDGLGIKMPPVSSPTSS